jgi:hypothetical protein
MSAGVQKMYMLTVAELKDIGRGEFILKPPDRDHKRYSYFSNITLEKLRTALIYI